MKLVSVMIPTRNNERTISTCLSSIKKQTYKDIEIIVVDNNSTDKTVEMSKKFTDNVFTKGPERASQRNFGALHAKGKYYLFIDSDMSLSNSVISDCVKAFKNNPELKAVTIPEESIGTGFWAESKKLERSFYLGIAWIEAPRFFPEDVFKKMNGYDENNTGTEDYDLPQRIKYTYGQSSVGRIESFIYHDEGNFSLVDSMKKKFYYGKKLTTYQSKKENKHLYKIQNNLLQRYLIFFSKPKKLLANPVVSIGLFTLKTAEFISGGLGYITSRIMK